VTEPTEWTVSVFVLTADATQVARAGEVLGRAVAGLGLEGIDASLRVGPSIEEEES
jgi:hypothetical protein